MTDAISLSVPVSAVVAAIIVPTVPGRRMAAANWAAAAVVGGLAAIAIARAAAAIADGRPSATLDPLGLVFLSVGAFVGLTSAILSPWYLRRGAGEFFGDGPRWYYFAFYLFWAALLAIPEAQNLGIAWVLVGVSTGVTCLLVAYSGRRRSLEAGWKYLVLTTLGLVIALFGILIAYSSVDHPDAALAALDWPALSASASTIAPPVAATALIFMTVGFAAKIGWAPVHHWLPDAHSEAPAPVSAMLSAALLPTVALVVWRIYLAVPGGSAGSSRLLPLAFGLVSLAVAVPFLWSPRPIKRVLAYSSLEHMGVIALGIGFANPIAAAGVLLHVAGHAVAKSLGFYATLPLLEADPAAARHPLRGAARTRPAAAAALGISLGALSGLPPSPLFVIELMIMVGGVASGQVAVVAVAAVLLALAFVGMTRQALDALLAPSRKRADAPAPGRGWWVLTIVMGALLLGLLGVAWWVFASPWWAALAGGPS